MSILLELQGRFRHALAGLAGDVQGLLEMVRPSQDPRFGDYQANFAMPLGKQLGRPPRDVAAEIVGRLDVADFCQPPEIAGPGFINLRLRDEWLAERAGRGGCATSGWAFPRSPSRGRSSSTTPPPTWPSRCTSATSARR